MMLKTRSDCVWEFNIHYWENNMKHTIAYLLILISFFTGCRKRELPQDIAGEPVFYASCNVEGKPVKIVAGSDNYEMVASCYKDTNSLYVYRADLRQKNCAPCGYGITVLFNDVSVTNAARNADSALKRGTYLFTDHNLNPVMNRSVFTPDLPQVAGSSYQWTIHDGVNSDRIYNTYAVQTDLDVNRTYSVSLKYSENGGCSSVHDNYYAVGNPVQANITPVKDNSGSAITYTYSSINTGNAPFVYKWEFNDGSANGTSSLPVVVHSYPVKPSGYYLTKLTLTDSDSNKCVSYYHIPATLQGGCLANFNSSFQPVQNSLSLSRITVLVNLPDGKVYSSRDAIQPQDSRFEVESVEDYQANSNHEPTKKIRIRFNCVVNSGGTPIKITNGEAVIAVSHK
jgi:hypothetical protein